MKTFHPTVYVLAVVVLTGSLAALSGEDTGTPPATNNVRYSIAVGGERAILVDGVSGQTWLLTESPAPRKSPAWLPLSRIDDSSEADEWRKGDRGIELQLEHLKSQLEIVQKRYSPNHPVVRELQDQIETLEQKQIEGLEKKLEEQEAPNNDSASIPSQLFPLLLEEQKLLETRGPQHPDVISTRKKIELMRSFLQEELKAK